jgi:hypothetical protein
MLVTFFWTQYLSHLWESEYVHAVALGLRVLSSLPLMLHYCWAWPPTSWRFDGDLPMLLATLSAALGDYPMARWVGPFFVASPGAVINLPSLSSRTPSLPMLLSRRVLSFLPSSQAMMVHSERYVLHCTTLPSRESPLRDDH